MTRGRFEDTGCGGVSAALRLRLADAVSFEPGGFGSCVAGKLGRVEDCAIGSMSCVVVLAEETDGFIEDGSEKGGNCSENDGLIVRGSG